MSGKTKYKEYLNILCLIILMLDSGGGLRLRVFALLVMFCYAIYGVFQYRTINKTFTKFYTAFMLSIIPGILVSLSSSIPIPEILIWITSFLMLPLFYFYIKGSEISQNTFVIAGAIFSLIIIILFFGRLQEIGIVVSINDYISAHSDGFFGNKNFLSGDVLPNVYFQGTLSLIICGGLSLRNKKVLPFILILMGLILAPSRFGFLVLAAWASFLFFRKSLLRLFLLPIILGIVFIILQDLAFGKELFSIFTGESDSIDIRNGHLSSVYHVFQDNPFYFFFGQGPGSQFFTTGTGGLAVNIEISQLEFIRKYGIISFGMFCLLYFMPLFGRIKSEIYIKGALVLYFMVSFSNPVLISIFSMLFLAFAYIEIYDNKQYKFDKIILK